MSPIKNENISVWKRLVNNKKATLLILNKKNFTFFLQQDVPWSFCPEKLIKVSSETLFLNFALCENFQGTFYESLNSLKIPLQIVSIEHVFEILRQKKLSRKN